MQSNFSKLVRFATLIVLGSGLFLTLGAAASPAAASHGSQRAIHIAGGTHTPASIANPNKITPMACSYVYEGYWIEKPNGTVIDVYPNVYNCSGTPTLDSVDYYWSSSGGVKLTNLWVYSKCGNWFSSESASPNVYLNSGNSHYQYAANSLVVDSYTNFDVDTSYSPGGEWTACI